MVQCSWNKAGKNSGRVWIQYRILQKWNSYNSDRPNGMPCLQSKRKVACANAKVLFNLWNEKIIQQCPENTISTAWFKNDVVEKQYAHCFLAFGKAPQFLQTNTFWQSCTNTCSYLWTNGGQRALFWTTKNLTSKRLMKWFSCHVNAHFTLDLCCHPCIWVGVKVLRTPPQWPELLLWRSIQMLYLALHHFSKFFTNSCPAWFHGSRSHIFGGCRACTLGLDSLHICAVAEILL